MIGRINYAIRERMGENKTKRGLELCQLDAAMNRKRRDIETTATKSQI